MNSWVRSFFRDVKGAGRPYLTEKCTKPEKFTKSFAKESTNTLNDTEEHDRNQHMSDILTYQQPPRFQKRRTKRNPRPPTTDQPEEMEATQDTQVNTKNITPNTRSTTGVTRLILLLTLILVFAACAVCFCDHRFSPETNWPKQWQTEPHRSENKSEQIKETSYQLRLCNLKNEKLKTFAIYAVCRFDRRFPHKTNWAKQWQKDPHRNENKSAQIKETPYRVRLCNPKNETVTTKLLRKPKTNTCLPLTQITQTTQTNSQAPDSPPPLENPPQPGPEAPVGMEEEATPADSSVSGKRSREVTMDDLDEESSENPRGTSRTGLSDRFQKTDIGAQQKWVSANDTVLEDPAVLAQFIQDIREGAEPPLGPTYGDIHETLGDTAAHGIIGSTRTAWHPSTKVGAPAGGGTLRQLNGVH